MDENEPFLKRWARLKGNTQTVPSAASVETGPAAAPPAGTAAPNLDQPAARETAEPFDLAELPRVDELTADSDIRRFLDVRVPAALRNAALRQAWSLDPTIRDFIEVAENQGNWNIPGDVQGYGPLEPGTDIEALLAQATGAIVKRDESKMASAARGKVTGDIAPSSAAGDEHRSMAAVQQTHPLEAEAAQVAHSRQDEIREPVGQVAFGPAGPEKDTASQHEIAADAPPDGLGRRRHGGALPA